MLQSQILLIDQTKKIGLPHLSAVAAAMQIQVNRDVSKFWPVSASISAADPGTKIPAGVWPVYIVESLPPGEGGYHWMTGSNQPYAVVLNGAGWTVATSHEIIEMLIDPFGNRLQSARSIELTNGEQTLGNSMESYLVEACDPVESHGYVINGVAVSDFITPDFYSDASGSGRYDFMGRIKTPMQILQGGYISWIDPATNDMMQLEWLGAQPSISNLGSATGKASLKEHVDSVVGSITKIAASADHEAVKLASGMA